MTRDYVALATRHITFKERHARKQCCKEYLQKDELKAGPMSNKEAYGNLYHFLFHKKEPVSYFPTK
jgi:hypothetical protein